MSMVKSSVSPFCCLFHWAPCRHLHAPRFQVLALSCGYVCYSFREPLRVPPCGRHSYNLASSFTPRPLNTVWPSAPMQVHSQPPTPLDSQRVPSKLASLTGVRASRCTGCCGYHRLPSWTLHLSSPFSLFHTFLYTPATSHTATCKWGSIAHPLLMGWIS